MSVTRATAKSSTAGSGASLLPVCVNSTKWRPMTPAPNSGIPQKNGPFTTHNGAAALPFGAIRRRVRHCRALFEADKESAPALPRNPRSTAQQRPRRTGHPLRMTMAEGESRNFCATGNRDKTIAIMRGRMANSEAQTPVPCEPRRGRDTIRRGTTMSGARFPLRLIELQRRRAVLVGLAFAVELAAACWLPMVRADDRAADRQAAELAARKRILANWQARQDRITSFYVAWKTGPDDQLSKAARASLPGIHQVWVASDGRFREEFSNFIFGDPLAVGRQQEVFDGHSLCRRWLALKLVAADGTLRDVPDGWFPCGTIAAPRDLDDRRINNTRSRSLSSAAVAVRRLDAGE